jgi:hypothetical protein
MTRWLILTATLPTHPSGLRVRVWRALKATGAGTLREGVYVLPEQAPSAQKLWDLERTITEAGATAHLLIVAARDAGQDTAFRALFNRSELYAELLVAIRHARSGLSKTTPPQLRKTLRSLEQQLLGIQSLDFFPGQDGQRAGQAFTALRREVARRLSPDEPVARAQALARLPVADYQGRTWATRRRPWVDRLATAWLVQRFIDRRPRFVWLADPRKCPRSALGYDFDGATFSHAGDKVTFEVVAESFGLLGDRALQRMAALVHRIDVGGIPVEEAPGFELLVRGLQALHAGDDALLTAAASVFDAAYAAMQATDEP